MFRVKKRNRDGLASEAEDEIIQEGTYFKSYS